MAILIRNKVVVLNGTTTNPTNPTDPTTPTEGRVVGKIPFDDNYFYQENTPVSSLDRTMFTKTPDYNTIDVWGQLYSEYLDNYIFPVENDVQLRQIKLGHSWGNLDDRPLIIRGVKQDDTEVLIYEWTAQGGMMSTTTYTLPEPLNLKSISFKVKNGNRPTFIELHGEYTPTPADNFPVVTKYPFGNQTGINGFTWSWAFNKALAEETAHIEDSYQALKGLGSCRIYLDVIEIVHEPGTYRFATNWRGFPVDDLFTRFRQDGIFANVCIQGMPQYVTNTWPEDERDDTIIPYGATKTDVNSYIEMAKVGFQVSARYGRNTNIPLDLIEVDPNQEWWNDKTLKECGKDLMDLIEMGNELDKWWKGPNANLLGREYAYFASAVYDGHKGTMGNNVGIKTADPTMQVTNPGLASTSPDFLIGFVEESAKIRGYNADGTVNIPLDGYYSFHCYSSTEGGQHASENNRGMCIEQSDVPAQLKRFHEVNHLHLGNKRIVVGESGYDISINSPLRAEPPAGSGITAYEWQGTLILRTALWYAKHGLYRNFFFTWSDDGAIDGWQFSSSGITETSGEYPNQVLTLRPSAKYLIQTNSFMRNHIWKEQINSSPLVDKWEHNGDIVYTVYFDTEVDNKGSYNLSLPGVTKIDRITLSDSDYTPTIQTSNINGTVAINATEKPVFIRINGSTTPVEPPIEVPETEDLTFSAKLAQTLDSTPAYLQAKTVDYTTPVSFTSSDEQVAKVKLIDSVWSVDYLTSGTATINAIQGSKTASKTITVAAKQASGRVINAVAQDDRIEISSALQGLQPGDTVIIPGGVYKNISIKNIIVPDGQPKITITCNELVTVSGDFNTWELENLRNVIIDGSRVPGVKYGMVAKDNYYVACYIRGEFDYITMTNFALKNTYNEGIQFRSNKVYNGTLNSYHKGCKFLNFLIDNSGGLNIDGSINMTNATDKIKGLCVDFEFSGWEIRNGSSGTYIRVSVGQDILFKNILLDCPNLMNDNHNGVFFVQGNADVINCISKNHQGNLLRLWHFTIVDGNINGRTTPKLCKFANNIVAVSRKYSAIEVQGFDYFYEPGVTSFINLDLYHNTIASLNQNIPSVFTGTLFDNYGLRGGRQRTFNNVMIAPVNPGANNKWFTFGAPNPDGVELTTGLEQEWNNRIYATFEDAKINPANLKPKVGSPIIGLAVASDITEDVYGTPFGTVVNIGAVQSIDTALAALPAPSVVDISETLESTSSLDKTPQRFAVTAKAVISPVGIKNYDIDINGTKTITTKGAYPRTGRQDPEQTNPDFLGVANTPYKFRFRARDWRDQLGAWSDYITLRVPSSTIETTTPINFTKTSGGVVTKTDTTYVGSDSTVFLSSGITIPAGSAARIIFDKPSDATKYAGLMGYALTNTVTNVNQIKYGISSWTDWNNLPTWYAEVIDGTTKVRSRDFVSTNILSLYVNYDGRVWVEVSYDSGKTWNKGGSTRYVEAALNSPNTDTKYIVAALKPGEMLVNPRYILYPSV